MNKYDNLSESDKKLVKEFVETHWNAQWFRRDIPPTLYQNHPSRMCKTLEVSVAYKPLNEMKSVLAFADKHQIAVEFLIVS